MGLFSAEMHDLATAIIHDEGDTVIAFSVGLLDPFRRRIALLLNDDGSW